MSDRYDPMNDMNGQDENDRPADEYRAAGPEEPRGSWSDAEYRTAETPRSFVPAPAEPPKKEPRQKKERRGMGAGAVIALCLVCALIGGLAGVGGSLLTRGGDASAAEPPALTDAPAAEEPAAETRAPASTAAPVLKSVASGSNASATSEIYELACRQTVGITTEVTYYNVFGTLSSGAVSGSGFIVSEDGYIMTNFHVIEEAYKGGYDVTVMLYDGSKYTAEIVGFDEDNDVAVLKIEASGLTAATLGDSDSMLVGETVYAIGNPLGELSYTMTGGMVSALDREITPDSSSNVSINMFQIDAAVNSGNSGGPVYNASGEVIGIVTAKYSDTGVEGLGFAIPINDAIYIANELIENGYVSGKAYMGVGVETVNESMAQYYNLAVGAYVYTINTGSCAETAGLQMGDIITAIDGEAISSSTELVAAVKARKAGDTVTLSVYRGGETLKLPITFDEDVPSNDQTQTQSRQQGQSYPYGFGYRG